MAASAISEKKAKKQAFGNQFKPGQSGNPSGRPKKDERQKKIEEMAREHSLEAIAALLEIAKSGSTDTARVAAATAILDRGWGTPVKRSEAGEPGDFDEVGQLSDEQLQEEKRELLELAVKSGDIKVLPLKKR